MIEPLGFLSILGNPARAWDVEIKDLPTEKLNKNESVTKSLTLS